jgi:hypothetical protein
MVAKMTPKEQYKRLLRALLKEREEAGGTLPMAVEYRYVEQLEPLWHSMTLAEQEEIERELTEAKGTQ